MDKVGIVTITYNSESVISSFLECICKQTYNNFVLYIIDNASTDSTISIIKAVKNTSFKIIENSKNYGVAKANNQGIIKAISDKCDQILLLNNDVEFESNLVEILLKVQKKYNCSLITPKMMYYNQSNIIWYAGSWFNKYKGYLPLHRGQKELDVGQFDKLIEVEYAPTCCLLIKKEVFEDIGLMNERYFVYFDDTDFCYRILKDGRHTILYVPNVNFYHKVGSLTKSFNFTYRGDFFIKQNTTNHVYFLKQIGGIFSYLFIVWLFFKNNISFIINPQIKKDFATWRLINRSYFKGIIM